MSFWLDGAYAQRTLVKRIPGYDMIDWLNKYSPEEKLPDDSVLYNLGGKGANQMGINNWKLKPPPPPN